MHEHIDHLIQTVRTGQATGLALTLAAMRAQLTAGVIDRTIFDDLTQRCQTLFQTLRHQDHAQLSFPLDAQASVQLDLSTNWIKTQYTLQFAPPASYTERWQARYPQMLTIDRHPDTPH